jgi:hypothetical protein
LTSENSILKVPSSVKRKAQVRLQRKAEDRLLESLARDRLSDEAIDLVLINAFLMKFGPSKKERLLSEAGVLHSSFLEGRLALAELARKWLSPSEIAGALAIQARKELPDEAEMISREVAGHFGLAADKRIGSMLTKAAKGVLTDISPRGGDGVVGREDQSITALGFAILGCGERVKAVFGPASARSPQSRKNPLRTPRTSRTRSSGSSS